MIDIVITSEDGSRRVWRGQSPVLVGRSDTCGIRIPGWRVARNHARLTRTPVGVDIEDLGSLAGTQVNSRRITRYGPLQPDDEIFIGGAMLQVRGTAEAAEGEMTPSGAVARDGSGASVVTDSLLTSVDALQAGQVDALAGALDATATLEAALPASRVGRDSPGAASHAFSTAGDAKSRGIAMHPGGYGPGDVAPSQHAGVASTDDRPADRASTSASTEALQAAPALAMASDKSDSSDPTDAVAAADDVRWRRRLHARLLDGLDLRRRDVSSMSDAVLREEAGRLLAQLIETDPELPPDIDRMALRQHVLDEAVGLGPLEGLLADDAVTEIMVNRFDEIFVERTGRLRRHPTGFSSERAVLGVIERIVAPLGRRIDESSPMVDARLRDGSRVNAVIAPVALRGASLTIRKFARRRLGIDDLIAVGAIDAAMSHFLRCCVEQRCNVLVSGGTGSGKTTLLNVLSNFIPIGERIITIEDAAELRLRHPHLVSLESRPANLEGRGAILIRDLVRNALRMRPDRIVIGECRGAEALDMLQAMNTGHEGSLTTLHANTPRDAIARLETLVLMAGMDLPLTAIREQIASAIDIVIQQTRAADGRRRITSIVELTGMESGRIQLQELFRFQPPRDGESPDGLFVGCGLIPGKLAAWRDAGVDIETDIFFGSTAARGARQTL